MEWRRYVPVAERRARARREMNRLRKKGKGIQPIEIEGRAIARSFWGKRWCEHLESFSDYANRLPRGRTYVRNGSVCHLAIGTGRIDAIVSGSELYDVTIRIGKLKAAVWKSVRSRCSGQIGSMLELLQGKLSRQVMTIVTDRGRGLFPKPGEIRFDCSCPDWASMCKHVASVLYGVGSRLDDRPESLFDLRGVDAAELISTGITLPGDAATEDVLADDALAGIFGIDLDTATQGATDTGGVIGRVTDDDGPPPAPKAPAGRRARSRQDHFLSPQASAACRLQGSGCLRHRGRRLVRRHPAHRPMGDPAAPPQWPLRRPIRRTARRLGGDRVPLGSHARPAQPARPPAEGPDGLPPAGRKVRKPMVTPFSAKAGVDGSSAEHQCSRPVSRRARGVQRPRVGDDTSRKGRRPVLSSRPEYPSIGDRAEPCVAAPEEAHGREREHERVRDSAR